MQQTQEQPTRHIAIFKPQSEYSVHSEGKPKRKLFFIFTATYSERAKIALQIFKEVCARQCLTGYTSEVLGFTKARLSSLFSERAIQHIYKPQTPK
jgi:hypothetical protein